MVSESLQELYSGSQLSTSLFVALSFCLKQFGIFFHAICEGVRVIILFQQLQLRNRRGITHMSSVHIIRGMMYYLLTTL
jgi:hypothetical protein